MRSIQKLKSWAEKLKQKILIIYFAYKNSKLKWYAKILAILIVAYAFSPIDLIPDFVPILGYLDDLILLPLGISLVIKLIPTVIMEENRIKADNYSHDISKNWIVGAVIIFIWLCCAFLLIRIFFFDSGT
jgi:uncharacterized membrane protein YkvA (DUF1232 family)